MTKPESIVHRLQAAFELALNEGLHQNKVDPSRVYRLRISSFPFCGLRWFLNLPNATKKISFMSSAMRYFVNIGSAVHTVMQDALVSVDLEPFEIELYADWKCKSCNHVHRFCSKPSKCKSCGKTSLAYEEISVDSKPVLGHIDTVFLVTLKKPTKEFPDGKFFVVIDYKTTSFKALGTKGKLPYAENAEQIRAYVNELHRVGHPTLPFAFLVYIPRDNPWKYEIKIVEVNYQTEEAKRERYIKRFKTSMGVKTIEDVESLVVNRPCRKGPKPLYSGCVHATYCPGSVNRVFITKKAEDVRVQLDEKLPMKTFFKVKV